jgi:hypothetical protein
LLSIRQAVRQAPPEIAAEHLQAVGLTMEAFDADLATVGVGARWVAVKGARGLGRLAGTVARLGYRLNAALQPPGGTAATARAEQ